MPLQNTIASALKCLISFNKLYNSKPFSIFVKKKMEYDHSISLK